MKYKQFRKHNLELMNRMEKFYDDMVAYDERLILFRPGYGSLLGLLTDEDVKERNSILEKFLSEYLPKFEQDIRFIFIGE